MTFAAKVALFIWAALLSDFYGPAATFHTSGNRTRDFFDLGYDAASRVTIEYDDAEKSSSAYDVAPARVRASVPPESRALYRKSRKSKRLHPVTHATR